MRAIAYYRTRPCDPSASKQSISEQRSAIAGWVASHKDCKVVAEHTEYENGCSERPILKAAMQECKEKGACLLIASTEAIGHGEPFYPRISSVPFIKLPSPRRAPGYIKPAAKNAPEGLSLFFDNHAEGYESDIYLCNESDNTIANITARLVGTTAALDDLSSTAMANDSRLLVTSTETRCMESLPARHMGLLSGYNAMFDGDFLLICDLVYRAEDDSKAKARAIVDKGHNGCGFVRFGHPENVKAIADIARTADRTTNLLSFQQDNPR
ncbi:MAG: recombinase family protein [Rhizobiales bacterium]|nr:recombinase family protein [Hyphomicrobiales bacterium]